MSSWSWLWWEQHVNTPGDTNIDALNDSTDTMTYLSRGYRYQSAAVPYRTVPYRRLFPLGRSVHSDITYINCYYYYYEPCRYATVALASTLHMGQVCSPPVAQKRNNILAPVRHDERRSQSDHDTYCPAHWRSG